MHKCIHLGQLLTTCNLHSTVLLEGDGRGIADQVLLVREIADFGILSSSLVVGEPMLCRGANCLSTIQCGILLFLLHDERQLHGSCVYAVLR